MDTNAEIEKIKQALNEITSRADAYFSEVIEQWRAVDMSRRHYEFENITDEKQRETAHGIAEDLARIVRKLPPLLKLSPLIGETDQTVLRKSTRLMTSALRFRLYREWGPEVINDEDQIVAVTPAGSEEVKLRPEDAPSAFLDAYNSLIGIVDLVGAPDEIIAATLAHSQGPSVIKFRPKTAFIMTAMDKGNPKFIDLKNIVAEVFAEFGIKAQRADDIEHSDVITKRILDEITTSEFLFADLTGERPSVYYEVGYAHALGRYPMLFRERGTPLHFDLAVHNCPDYSNFTELRELLRKRLSAITNKA